MNINISNIFDTPTYYKFDDPFIVNCFRQYNDNDIKLPLKKKETKIMNKLLDELKKSKLLYNPNFRRKVVFYSFLFITLTLITSNPVYAAAEVEGLEKVNKFIDFIIGLIGLAAGSISALIAANIGWKVLTTEEIDAKKEAKKGFGNVMWALFLIFVGSGIAKFIAYKVSHL